MIHSLRFRLLGLIGLIIVLAVTAVGLADRQLTHFEVEVTELRPPTGEEARAWVFEEELVELNRGLGVAPGSTGRGPGLRDLGRNQVLVAAIIAMLAVMLVSGILRRLIRPLERLTAVAYDVGRGKLDRRVGVQGNDEIGRLGQAFDAMAAQLEAAEKQRRDLVNDVAHELRTPLTNLRGQLEGVLDGVLPMDRTVVHSLLEESLQLGRLVDDLQDLSLAEAGRLRLDQRWVSVAELIEKAVEGIALGQSTGASPAALPGQANRLHIVVEVDPSLRVRADPVRLRQILDNLLSNASRYAASEIRIHATNSTGDAVEISVTDDGPGIPPEDLPHVFDRFYRVDSSRQRTTGGSGLGLAITRRLVEAHGGSISIEKAAGTGACVRLVLPRE